MFKRSTHILLRLLTNDFPRWMSRHYVISNYVELDMASVSERRKTTWKKSRRDQEQKKSQSDSFFFLFRSTTLKHAIPSHRPRTNRSLIRKATDLGGERRLENGGHVSFLIALAVLYRIRTARTQGSKHGIGSLETLGSEKEQRLSKRNLAVMNLQGKASKKKKNIKRKHRWEAGGGGRRNGQCKRKASIRGTEPINAEYAELDASTPREKTKGGFLQARLGVGERVPHDMRQKQRKRASQ